MRPLGPSFYPLSYPPTHRSNSYANPQFGGIFDRLFGRRKEAPKPPEPPAQPPPAAQSPSPYNQPPSYPTLHPDSPDATQPVAGKQTGVVNVANQTQVQSRVIVISHADQLQEHVSQMKPGTKHTIGRRSDEGATLEIPAGATISAKHCKIERDTQGDYYLKDLGSTNGTYVIEPGETALKQMPAQERWFLHPGTRVIIGKVKGQEYISLNTPFARVNYYFNIPENSP